MSKELSRMGSPPETLQSRLRESLQSKFGTQTRMEFSGEQPVLLLDTTGSMWGSPIKKLREAIRPFSGIRRFWYNDSISELGQGDEIPEPKGGNNEPKAFNFLKSLGIKHLILVTDGHPDDPPGALRAAAGLKIDIIYIGPEPVPQFLRDLAGATGGSFDSIKFSAEGGKLLENSIRARLLIEAPKEDKKGGAIQL